MTDRLLLLLSDQATSFAASEEIAHIVTSTAIETTYQITSGNLNAIKAILTKREEFGLIGLFSLLRNTLASNSEGWLGSDLDFLFVFLNNMPSLSEGSHDSILRFLQIFVEKSESAVSKFVENTLLFTSLANVIDDHPNSPPIIESACHVLKSLSDYPCAKPVLGACSLLIMKLTKAAEHSTPRARVHIVKCIQSLTADSKESQEGFLKLGILSFILGWMKKADSKDFTNDIINVSSNFFGHPEYDTLIKKEFVPKVLEFLRKDISNQVPLLFFHKLFIGRIPEQESSEILNQLLDFLMPQIQMQTEQECTSLPILLLLRDYSFLATVRENKNLSKKQILPIIYCLLNVIGVGTKERRGQRVIPNEPSTVKEALNGLINLSFNDKLAQQICFEAGFPLFDQLFSLYETHPVALALMRNLCIDQLACKHILNVERSSAILGLVTRRSDLEERTLSYQLLRNLSLQHSPSFFSLHSLPHFIPELLYNLRVDWPSSTSSSSSHLQLATLDILDALGFSTSSNLKAKAFRHELIKARVLHSLMTLQVDCFNPEVARKAALLHEKLKQCAIADGSAVDPFFAIAACFGEKRVQQNKKSNA